MQTGVHLLGGGERELDEVPAEIEADSVAVGHPDTERAGDHCSEEARRHDERLEPGAPAITGRLIRM